MHESMEWRNEFTIFTKRHTHQQDQAAYGSSSSLFLNSPITCCPPHETCSTAQLPSFLTATCGVTTLSAFPAKPSSPCNPTPHDKSTSSFVTVILYRPTRDAHDWLPFGRLRQRYKAGIPSRKSLHAPHAYRTPAPAPSKTAYETRPFNLHHPVLRQPHRLRDTIAALANVQPSDAVHAPAPDLARLVHGKGGAEAGNR
ncbi:hypothetical protein FA15DRAFT_760971 [Coprinopsis marcescibilis]|uniref:Uncharacterized protein n=1 Tax=Coprinopsis marcescibilis TaxID=230819 RepID=A0A5C3KC65_COPMA|nr:hypothetical protein FA15DRAFT_760971 [Coprinopsis marcescibilis]